MRNNSRFFRSLVKTSARPLLLTTVSFSAGYFYATITSRSKDHDQQHHLPSSLPRTCCEQQQQQEAFQPLIRQLRKIVGPEHVTSQPTIMKGARLGQGTPLCVVTPTRLIEVVECVQAIVDANCVVLPQGQNTGLTGGSVPHQASRRPTVILNFTKLNRIFPIDNGQRVVCLPGVGLAQLSQFLQQHFPDRESHSTLGSTFLNPTVAAGVAFGSGGTQCRKGPAYTERALYLTVSTNKWRENVIHIHDTLAIQNMQEKDLDDRARKMDSIVYILDTWSRWIDGGFVRDMRYSTQDAKPASDTTYRERLCQHNDQVSRYNADTRGPDLNRSEGKVIILATVHDTFEKPKATKTFWLGFDSLETALAFRQEVCLDNPNDVPISAEYMDRDAFDVCDQAGRLMGLPIKYIGTSSPLLRKMWNVKLWIETFNETAVDRFLHAVNPFVPSLLPSDIMKTGKEMDHHVAMTVGEFGDGNMERLLNRLQAFATKHGRDKIRIHEVAPSDVPSLTAFRFIAAPAFRTWCVGQGAQGFSVDYALPKNGGQVPSMESEDKVLKRMRYSHFACNVVHEDVAFPQGVNVEDIKQKLKASVEEAKGKLPAEHGHGTEYKAPQSTKDRWMRMDPLNVLNPGIGGTSSNYKYE